MSGLAKLSALIRTVDYRLPLACMMIVPITLVVGYGIALPIEAWSTPKPMLLGLTVLGMLLIIAGLYMMAGSSRERR